MVDQIRSIGADDATDDDKRDTSADRTCHKQHAAADFVNPEQRRECAKRVDDAVHASRQEGSLQSSVRLQMTSLVVLTVLLLRPSWPKIVGA